MNIPLIMGIVFLLIVAGCTLTFVFEDELMEENNNLNDYKTARCKEFGYDEAKYYSLVDCWTCIKNIEHPIFTTQINNSRCVK